MNRHALMGLIHTGARRLLGTDCRDTYESWLARETGARSCTALTDPQLSRLVDTLRAAGALPATAPDRPTPKQKAAILALVRARGWTGISDPGFVGWCQHTTGRSHPKFLTRTDASAVIMGLQRWASQQETTR